MKRIVWLLIILVMAVPACTWVKPTEAGARVVVNDTFSLRHCDKLGTTTTSVKHKVGSLDRKAEKVTQELVTLARNEAAVMGGNAISSRGPVEDGSMVFDVYSCPE